MLICEETGANTSNIKDHARNKHEAFLEIHGHLNEFFDWFISEFKIKNLNFSYDQFCIKFLYFSQKDLPFNKDEFELYPLIKFVTPNSFNYLYNMANCIEKSVKYELFKFLELSNENIGIATSEGNEKRIKATIILPKSSTGLKNDVRIVSFMMSADTLIKNAYVLRKDSWEDSLMLYQRLIKKDKIKNIRTFLKDTKETFYNNIIVALPDDVRFIDNNNKQMEIENISNYDVCNMTIPDRINSICVIDGQHRIYAYYEGKEDNAEEKTIASLRNRLHLLVTGLIFPEKMSATERGAIQSKIFLDINSNAKPVPQDVLLHIRAIKDPLSDVGLARMIIEKLNSDGVFKKRFEMSSLDKKKIKIASIIKFALRYLVTITPKEGTKSLYSFWNGDKTKLKEMDDDTLEEYKKFCYKELNQYFSAVKSCFSEEWDEPESKILSVVSINGFILAYNKFIQDYELKDFDYFYKQLSNLQIDFSKENFPYTSSQYGKFSDKILNNGLIDSKK